MTTMESTAAKTAGGSTAGGSAPATGRSRRLHLGCGLVTPPTWLNVDGSLNARLGKYPLVRSVARMIGLTSSRAEFDKSVYGHDLRRRLPWADGSFDAVYASHLFEHMYVDEVERLLAECRRVLAPGGVLRVVVPDVEVLINGYVTGKFPAWTRDHIKEGPRADMLITGLLMRDPEAPRGGLIKRVYQSMFDFHSHKWMYDGESMKARFEKAGFKDVRRMGFGESRIEGILDVEREIRVADGAGVVVEGVKP
ncbi:MAG: class I SAM-dependent methyltransferase [Phycisphaerales bacterium]